MPLMMPSSFHPTGDGDYLLFGDDHGRTSRRSAGTRRTTPTPTSATTTTSTGSCQAVRPLFDNAPPNVFGKDPEDQADVKPGCSTTSAASSRR